MEIFDEKYKFCRDRQFSKVSSKNTFFVNYKTFGQNYNSKFPIKMTTFVKYQNFAQLFLIEILVKTAIFVKYLKIDDLGVKDLKKQRDFWDIFLFTNFTNREFVNLAAYIWSKFHIRPRTQLILVF